MSRVLRPVRKRKKGRTLGPVNIIQREDYTDLELDTKVELIWSLIPLGLMHVQEVLDQEVDGAGRRALRPEGRVGRGDAVTAPTPGRWVWRGSGCQFACHGCAMSRGARCRSVPTRRCVATVKSTTCC